MLELVLKAGGDPTLPNPNGQTPIAEALLDPSLKENVRLLRKYAKPFLKDKKGASVSVRRSRKVDLESERHAKHLRALFRDETRWELLAANAPFDVVCDVLATQLEKADGSACEVFRDAHKRLVTEEKEQVFVLRLRHMPWTLVIKRLGWFGRDGLTWLKENAEKLSSQSEASVLALWGTLGFKYEGGRLLEEKAWGISDVEQSDLNLAAENERLDEDDAYVDTIEQRLFELMDVYLAEHELLLPAMEDTSDGYIRRLTVSGVKKSDIENMAVITLENYED